MQELLINNRKIKIFKTSELLKLKIIKPSVQRIIDRTNLQELLEYQLNEIRENSKSNFIGVINIHYCEEDNIYYLVDGQHRFITLEKLYENYAHDIEIFVEIVNVKNKDELIKNYNIINKNTSLPEYIDDIDKSIPEKASEYFQTKYPDMWSKTKNNRRPRRPHISFNDFQETLGYLTKILNIKTSNELILIVEEHNKTMSNYKKSAFKDGLSDNMYEKAHNSKFYLGCDKFTTNDDWGYKWAKNIVEHKTGKTIKNKRIKFKAENPKSENPKLKSENPKSENPKAENPKLKSENPKSENPKLKSENPKAENIKPKAENIKPKTKKNIPKTVKDGSWDKYVGNKFGETKCPVCNITTIGQTNCHAGHIISDKEGGPCIVDNIIPICSSCNTSIGPQNMDLFVQQHHPENYKRYISRDYKPQSKNIFHSLNNYLKK